MSVKINKTNEEDVVYDNNLLDDIEGNYNSFSWLEKVESNIHLFIGNYLLMRSDIHRCPNCRKLTLALQRGVTGFGWKFRTKCHRCNHVFEWTESMF